MPSNNGLLRVGFALLPACLAIVSHGDAARAGPVSPYFIESSNTKTLYRVEGSSVVASSTTYCNHCESAIAVVRDVRSIGVIGGLYGLNTAQQGITYPFPFNPALQYRFVDGTTNGLRNFSTTPTIDSNFNPAGPTVFSFDRVWADPVALFSMPANYFIDGITYDPSNGSLWLQGSYQSLAGTRVYFVDDFAMDGTDLGGFDDSAPTGFGGHALAMDYADGTLWSIYGPGSSFTQWSRTGVLLQTMTIPDLGGLLSSAGAEFPLPEPGTMTVLAAGTAMLGMIRRRRKPPAAL